MGFFSDLFSSGDPEKAIKECSGALGKVWEDLEDQLSERGDETVLHQFIRHPFVLGTVYGFVQDVARRNGVESNTEAFDDVLVGTLQFLVGSEVATELRDEIDRLWVDPSEGDPQFKKGLTKGSDAGMAYAEGLQTAGEVLTVEGVVDKGPRQPMYAKWLSESYWEILEDELL